MPYIVEGDELLHYGVQGMRWGVRNTFKNIQGKYRARRAAKIKETAAKRKRILTEKGYAKKLVLRDAGKSALASALLTFGATKLTGGSTATAGRAAANMAAAGAAISTALNAVGYAALKFEGE